MALRGHVFDKQLFSSDCYALVTDTFLNKNSGIIKGCDLTNTASSIYIDNGYFVVKGRPIQEEGGTTIEVEPGSLEGIYCKLVCEIDMSQTNTTTSLNQVSYKILEDTADYPTLVLEDITDGGTIYQFELAKFRRTLNGIEDFVDTRSFLNFDSIYDFVKNEIKKIEEGSLFITEEELETEMLNSGVVVSSTEPTGSDRNKVWIRKGKNLFNSTGLPSQTSLGVTTTFNNSEFILNGTSTKAGILYSQTPTQMKLPKGDYTFSFNLKSGTITKDNQECAFYLRKSGTETNISTISLKGTGNYYVPLTLTEETSIDVYAWVNAEGLAYNEVVYEIQIEAGTVMTEHEPRIKPKIYVLNDNGVYEEFISKDNLVNYSTGEQVIGKWINGKNLYRKIGYVGETVISSSETTVRYIDLPTDATPINASAIVYTETSGYGLFVNSSYVENGFKIRYMSGQNSIQVIATEDVVDEKSFSAYVIVEYIKTTD